MSRLVRLAITTALVGIAAATPDVAFAGDEKRPVAAIEDDLVADDPAVRAAAATSLADRFPDGAIAVPMLLDLLDDEDRRVAEAAAGTLRQYGVAAATSIARFAAVDANLPGFEGNMAISAIVPQMIDAFRDPNAAPTAGELLVAGLVARGDTVGEAPYLVRLAREGRGDGRLTALTALAALGSGRNVAWDLGQPPPGHAEAVSAALTLLASKQDNRAWAGARLLAKLHAGDSRTIEALVRAVLAPARAGDPSYRLHFRVTAALDALRAARPPAVTAVPRLAELLARSGQSELAGQCADLLCDLGPAAEKAARAFLATKHGNCGLVATRFAMRGFVTDAVVPVLQEVVAQDSFVDEEVKRALIALGPRASGAWHAVRSRAGPDFDADPAYGPPQWLGPALAIRPGDAELLALGRRCMRAAGSAHVRADCAWAVLLGDRDDEEAVRTILEADDDGPPSWLVSTDRYAPVTTLATLVRLAPRQRLVVKSLLEYPAWSSGYRNIALLESLALQTAFPGRDRLARALVEDLSKPEKAQWKLPRPSETASPLLQPLASPAVVKLLGQFGPDAVVAVPVLETWKAKGDEIVRVRAAHALRRIRAKR